jgi:cell division septum initiation protein DivIVA
MIHADLGKLLNKQHRLKQNIKELEKKKQELSMQIESLEKDKQFYLEQKVGQGGIAIMRVSADTFRRFLSSRLPNKIEVIGE